MSEPKSVQKYLANNITALYHCADCNYCVDAVWESRHLEHVCPTLEHHSPALSYSGKGYIKLARALLEGEEYPLEQIAERVFSCTGCGNCDRVCPIGLSPLNVNWALRELLVDNAALPSKLRDKLIEKTASDAADEEISGWLANVSQPTLDTTDVLFIPGCEALQGATAEIRASFDILRAIHPNAAVVGNRVGCCGAKMKELGSASTANTAFKSLNDELNIYPRIEFMVHASPKCQQTFGDKRPTLSFPGWLAEETYRKTVSIQPRLPLPTVHCLNTCAVRPWNQDVQRLFEACELSVKNDDFCTSFSLCCGAGGGMPAMQAIAAQKMALASYENIANKASDNDILIVPDPNCLSHIRGSVMAAAPAMQIYGLAEFMTAFFTISRAAKPIGASDV